MKTKAQAMEALKELKKYLKYGTSTCPVWIRGFCVGMRREGNYDIDVCIYDWSEVPEAEKAKIPVEVGGIAIGFRVTPKNTYVRK